MGLCALVHIDPTFKKCWVPSLAFATCLVGVGGLLGEKTGRRPVPASTMLSIRVGALSCISDGFAALCCTVL
jgi:hypothetical protein